MFCQSCQGKGFKRLEKGDRSPESGKLGNERSRLQHSKVCDDCGGYGVAHCCDGLCEQPEGK
jgi:hypothetical protein